MAASGGVPLVVDTSTVAAFMSLCAQLEYYSSLSIKTELVQGYLARYFGDVALLFRLLLPKFTGRRYNMQDKSMGKLLGQLLGISEDALREDVKTSGCIAISMRQLYLNKRKAVMEAAAASGADTTATAVAALPVRVARSTMPLVVLDGYLQRMDGLTTEDAQRATWQNFIRTEHATIDDMFAFTRQLKQDLHLGAGIKVLLAGLHPSANELFRRCANIASVVRAVASGEADALPPPGGDDDDGTDSPPGTTARGGSPVARGGSPVAGGRRASPAKVTAAISLGTPVAPMLAEASKGVASVLSKCPNGAFSEVKYDGERIQVHKITKPGAAGDASTGGSTSSLTFFARSLKAMKPDKYEGLEKFLMSAIVARECILDGEILLVDTTTSQPLPFGTLGKHKKAQFATANTAVFLFDVLYVDGRTLLDLPLEERREILKQVVRFIPNRIMLSEMRLVKGTPEERTAILTRHLSHAIAYGLEGLVVKDVKSRYEPGSRHWVKVKKDYMDGCADTVDLVVLGGWYGSGSKGGVLSIYLMGCRDERMEPGTPKEWKTVTKVGNGHDDATLGDLTKRYATFMVSTRGRPVRDAATGAEVPGKPQIPAWLDVSSSHIPDVVVKDPYRSDVWEIMGTEFTQTKAHTADGVSLRFPRVARIRGDKDARTATTLGQLKRLVATAKASVLSTADRKAEPEDGPEDDEDIGTGAPPPTAAAAYRPHHDDGPSLRGTAAAAARAAPPVAHQPSILNWAVAVTRGGGAAPSSPTSSLPHPRAVGAHVPPAGEQRRREDVVGTRPVSAATDPYSSSPPAALLRHDSLAHESLVRAPTAAFAGDDNLRVITHDMTQPFVSPKLPNLVLLHAVALGGRWSKRGVMGSISRALGDEPQEEYDAQSKSMKLGNVQFVSVTNRHSKGKMFVGNLVCQELVSGGGGGGGGAGGGMGVKVNADALSVCLEKCARFARENDCSVHLARPDGIAGGYFYALVKKHLVDQPQTVASPSASPTKPMAAAGPDDDVDDASRLRKIRAEEWQRLFLPITVYLRPGPTPAIGEAGHRASTTFTVPLSLGSAASADIEAHHHVSAIAATSYDADAARRRPRPPDIVGTSLEPPATRRAAPTPPRASIEPTAAPPNFFDGIRCAFVVFIDEAAAGSTEESSDVSLAKLALKVKKIRQKIVMMGGDVVVFEDYPPTTSEVLAELKAEIDPTDDGAGSTLVGPLLRASHIVVLEMPDNAASSSPIASQKAINALMAQLEARRKGVLMSKPPMPPLTPAAGLLASAHAPSAASPRRVASTVQSTPAAMVKEGWVTDCYAHNALLPLFDDSYGGSSRTRYCWDVSPERPVATTAGESPPKAAAPSPQSSAEEAPATRFELASTMLQRRASSDGFLAAFDCMARCRVLLLNFAGDEAAELSTKIASLGGTADVPPRGAYVAFGSKRTTHIVVDSKGRGSLLPATVECLQEVCNVTAGGDPRRLRFPIVTRAWVDALLATGDPTESGGSLAAPADKFRFPVSEALSSPVAAKVVATHHSAPDEVGAKRTRHVAAMGAEQQHAAPPSQRAVDTYASSPAAPVHTNVREGTAGIHQPRLPELELPPHMSATRATLHAVPRDKAADPTVFALPRHAGGRRLAAPIVFAIEGYSRTDAMALAEKIAALGGRVASPRSVATSMMIDTHHPAIMICETLTTASRRVLEQSRSTSAGPMLVTRTWLDRCFAAQAWIDPCHSDFTFVPTHPGARSAAAARDESPSTRPSPAQVTITRSVTPTASIETLSADDNETESYASGRNSPPPPVVATAGQRRSGSDSPAHSDSTESFYDSEIEEPDGPAPSKSGAVRRL